MGSRRIETITDCVRDELDLRVSCLGCGYTVTMISDDWLNRLVMQGKPIRIREIERKLRCTKCGARNSQVVPVVRF